MTFQKAEKHSTKQCAASGCACAAFSMFILQNRLTLNVLLGVLLMLAVLLIGIRIMMALVRRIEPLSERA